jgi:hypothetical protein
MLKENLKFIGAILLVALIVFAGYKAKSYLFPIKVSEENKICIVTQVEFHRVGSVSVAQVDDEWKATTDCGETYTYRREVKVGDTVIIKILKHKNNDRIFK